MASRRIGDTAEFTTFNVPTWWPAKADRGIGPI